MELRRIAGVVVFWGLLAAPPGGGSVLDTKLPDNGRLRLVQEAGYPWSGSVRITIESAPEREFALRLRIPG